MNSKNLNYHLRQKAYFYTNTALSLCRDLALSYLPLTTNKYEYPMENEENQTDPIFGKVAHMREQINQVWSVCNLPPKNRSELPLTSYSQALVRTSPILSENLKKQEFTSVVFDEVKRILGETVAHSVVEQLNFNHSISTAQHFTPLTSPNTFNATLQTALGYLGKNDPAHQNIIVFSCSNISFDNTYFPRGLIFHTNKETIDTQQLVFFPRKVRSFPVVFNPGYDKNAIEKMKEEIQLLFTNQTIDNTTKEKLIAVIDEVYGNEWVLTSPTYTDQVTKTNFLLWKKIFSNVSEYVPNLVFISQEEIVLKLLEKYHLFSDTLINKFLFDPTYMALIEKHFDDIQGGFSLAKQTGSYLFWAKPQGEKYRIQLFRKDQTLTSLDGSYVLPLTPLAIAQAMEKQELIPSTLLSMIVLSCYYGAILTGGLDQPRYLPQIQNGYNKIRKEMDEDNELVHTTPTTDTIFTRPVLAFMENQKGMVEGASGLDFCMYENTLEDSLKSADHVTIGDVIVRLLPTLYRWYVPKQLWKEELLQVSTKDIEHILPLQRKIPSSIIFS